MVLWIDPDVANVRRANRALAEFGSPYLLEEEKLDEILQLGVAPNRIDLLREPGAPGSFADLWPRRIESRYGRAPASWIDLDGLLAIKSHIDHPRHREDARILQSIVDQKKRR